MTVDQATGYDELQAACGRIGYCPRIRPLPLLAPTAFWPTYRRLWHAMPSGPFNAHDDVDVRLVPYCHESVRTDMATYLDIGECIDDNHMESRPVLTRRSTWSLGLFRPLSTRRRKKERHQLF